MRKFVVVFIFFLAIAIGILFFERDTYENFLLFCKSLLSSFLLVFVLTVLTFIIEAWIFPKKDIFKAHKPKKEKPILLSDQEIEDSSENSLWEEKADIQPFAEGVLNNYSSVPIVFGLDAPWGAGKSSFLNLCRKLVWEKEEKERKLLYFQFSLPVGHRGGKEIAKCFVEQLQKKLSSEKISPLLVENLSQYLNSINMSVGGFSLNFLFRQKSLEEILNSIKDNARDLDKKMLIVVDDLDRMYLEEIKSILLVIRNVFLVENFSFIICYDSCAINTADTQFIDISYKQEKDNNNVEVSEITHHETDNQKINTYLEKFVQIKKILIPKREKLLKYCQKLLEGKCGGEDSEVVWKKGFEDVFSSETYNIYQPLIGDIRKIKRIFNFLFLSEVIKSDLSKTDIDPSQMIKVILIYINYPHTFRDIYTNETEGRYGFVSLIGKELNSKVFWKYLKKKTEQEQKILHDIFCYSCAKGKKGNCLRLEQSPEDFLVLDRTEFPYFKEKSPMFNGGYFGGNKNLEDYLKRIVEHVELPLSYYFEFHRKMAEKVIRKDTLVSVEDIFSRDEYHLEKGERFRKMFFDACVYISQDQKRKGVNMMPIIDYILENRFRYTILDFLNTEKGDYEGIRHDIVLALLIILNNYLKLSANESPSQPEAIKELFLRKKNILTYILEDGHDPILSIEEAFIFRNSLEQFPYLCKELEEKFKLGDDLDVWVKKEIFEYFEKKFITSKKNCITYVYSDTKKALFGDYEEYIKNFVDEKTIKIKIRNTLRIRIGKIMYSFLGKLMPEKNRVAFSDYLFSVCFNPNCDEGIKSFLYGMVAFLERDYKEKYFFPIKKLKEEFFDSKNALAIYWEKNHKTIKKYAGNNKKELLEMLFIGQTSEEEIALEDIFKELDTLR